MCFLFADPHAFEQHFHLVNRGDLETFLKVAIFVNEADKPSQGRSQNPRVRSHSEIVPHSKARDQS